MKAARTADTATPVNTRYAATNTSWIASCAIRDTRKRRSSASARPQTMARCAPDTATICATPSIFAAAYQSASNIPSRHPSTTASRKSLPSDGCEAVGSSASPADACRNCKSRGSSDSIIAIACPRNARMAAAGPLASSTVQPEAFAVAAMPRVHSDSAAEEPGSRHVVPTDTCCPAMRTGASVRFMRTRAAAPVDVCILPVTVWPNEVTCPSCVNSTTASPPVPHSASWAACTAAACAQPAIRPNNMPAAITMNAARPIETSRQMTQTTSSAADSTASIWHMNML